MLEIDKCVVLCSNCHAELHGILHDENDCKVVEECIEAKKKFRSNYKHQHSGTCWIMNDVESKKINSSELNKWIDKGYKKGRKLKFD